MANSIAYVPPEFKPPEFHLYPIDNKFSFEGWYYDSFRIGPDDTDRVYLPILWTAYLKNNNYGQDVKAIQRLQQFIDSLDKTKKYYSICQFDDGPKVDLSGIDIFMFSMAGKPCDFKLPLLCQPHAWTYPNERRDIFASFVGRNTQEFRGRAILALSKINNDGKNWYVSTYNHPMPEYCRILAKSIFSICPRGYSANSFRILESVQQGAIPVIVSDEMFIPEHLNFEDFGVIIGADDLYNIDKILGAISGEEIKSKQSKLSEVFEKYYTYESNKQIILKTLRLGMDK